MHETDASKTRTFWTKDATILGAIGVYDLLEDEVKTGWKVGRRTAIFLGLAVVLAVTILGTSYSFSNLQACQETPASISFTIIMTNEGFNGSKTHTDPWPVLNVGRCDRVTVHIENQDLAEPHGFAITHYLDSGVKVLPGQTVDVSFNAIRAGTFTVYCNLVCSIHTIMLNGRLNVR